MATPAAAMLIFTLRSPSSNPQTASVSRLIHVQPSGSSEQPALLALGGQVVGAPPELWAFTSLQVRFAHHKGHVRAHDQGHTASAAHHTASWPWLLVASHET